MDLFHQTSNTVLGHHVCWFCLEHGFKDFIIKDDTSAADLVDFVLQEPSSSIQKVTLDQVISILKHFVILFLFQAFLNNASVAIDIKAQISR